MLIGASRERVGFDRTLSWGGAGMSGAGPEGGERAAALWAAGVLSWRTTRRDGRPRRAFCGIGSCFDCLATVNGQPNQRACLVPARPGDAITTQEGHGRADLAV
nr:(2Fe-2S)-binding protein [Streptomyces sp. NRRL S-1813]